jgi:hypothetical protein
LSNKLIKRGFNLKAYIIDGTGWSYRDLYPLKLLRGKEVRKIKSHVRTIALVGISAKKRMVLAALSGKAYANEVKLAIQLLFKTQLPRDGPFLADKAYDSIDFLELIEKKGGLPIVDIKGKKLSLSKNFLFSLAKISF